MSARQVLTTTDGLLRDGALGFVKAMDDLLVAQPAPGGVTIRSATDITRKRVRDKMPATSTPRLALTLRTADSDLVQAGARDGHVQLQLAYESFEANEDTLQYQIAYAASAVSKVMLENLRPYSDAHAGTVVDVENALSFQFGEFDGPVSAGFIATITITERSAE